MSCSWQAPCPICATSLVFGLLEIPEDDGAVVRLLTYDCPVGDDHGVMQEGEVQEMFAKGAVRRMQLLRLGT